LMVDNQAGPILVAASRLTAAGNTTGVYVSSTYGFPNVVVSDSSLDLNTLGVDLRVFGTMTLRNSTVKNSFLSDITNTMGVLFLLDHNTIGIVENHSGGSQSDGTNNIGSVLDIALVKVNPQ